MKTAKEFYKDKEQDCFNVCSHADGCVVINADADDKKELRKEYKFSIYFRCPIIIGCTPME